MFTNTIYSRILFAFLLVNQILQCPSNYPYEDLKLLELNSKFVTPMDVSFNQGQHGNKINLNQMNMATYSLSTKPTISGSFDLQFNLTVINKDGSYTTLNICSLDTTGGKEKISEQKIYDSVNINLKRLFKHSGTNLEISPVGEMIWAVGIHKQDNGEISMRMSTKNKKDLKCSLLSFDFTFFNTKILIQSKENSNMSSNDRVIPRLLGSDENFVGETIFLFDIELTDNLHHEEELFKSILSNIEFDKESEEQADIHFQIQNYFRPDITNKKFYSNMRRQLRYDLTKTKSLSPRQTAKYLIFYGWKDGMHIYKVKSNNSENCSKFEWKEYLCLTFLLLTISVFLHLLNFFYNLNSNGSEETRQGKKDRKVRKAEYALISLYGYIQRQPDNFLVDSPEGHQTKRQRSNSMYEGYDRHMKLNRYI